MQKSPIACRPLADWHGQTVRFQGYLNHWETANKTGDTACLLRNVKVVPYKGCKEQVRTLDHIWLYLNQDACGSRFERLGSYAAVGQVVSYTRSNGTKDYAIDIGKTYVPIDSQVELIKSYGGPQLEQIKNKTILLKETIDLLESEELNFSIYLSYDEIYQRFYHEYEFCHNQVEINERYQAKKQYRSRPNTNVVKFAAAASKSTKVASKGFATVS